MGESMYCEWCEKQRFTYTTTDTLNSPDLGKLGEHTHSFCSTCGFAIKTEFRRFTWYVVIDGDVEFGPFKHKLGAMDVARVTNGLDVRVRARTGNIER